MESLPPPLSQFDGPDPVLTKKIVTQLKSQGILDQFRRECMADVDTKPAYQNLRQRVEGSVAAFLKKNPWRPDMNKNQLRDNLRKHIQSGGFLDIGVDRIVDQVVNPKIYSVFLPKVQEVVHSCVGKKCEIPPNQNVMPETPKFQNKHNLAPRARIPAPLTGPRMPSIPNIEALKPPDPVKDDKNSNESKQTSASDPGSPEQENTEDEKYVVDEEDAEEDDEESPPFEPVSENDRSILGIHSDYSDSNSNDSQVVTAIIDDHMEEQIDNDDSAAKEELKAGSDEREQAEEIDVKEESDENEAVDDSDEKEAVEEKDINDEEKDSDGKEESDEKEEVKKEYDYNSDEYVIPKTPTINLESSDGTVIEFNSISEYKQYQTKYDEESLDNVEEEVVSSQWVDESSNTAKEYRSSNEEGSSGYRKRRLIDQFDDASSSSIDKGSTSDEGKSNKSKKRMKVEDEENEITVNDDSNPEQSHYMTGEKHKSDDHKRRHKSSSSSKDSGKSHRHRDSSKHQSSSHSNEKSSEKDHRKSSILSSHSPRDKKLSSSSKNESYKDRNKDKDPNKYDAITGRSHESSRSKNEKTKEKDVERNRVEHSNSDNKEISEIEKEKSETRHDSKDRPKSHHDKEKKKHDGHDKHSSRMRDHSSSHRQDEVKTDSSKSSKHSHSSSRHSHRSSTEKIKTEKDNRHKSSSDKSKSHDKKSDKDSKKKPREHCKSSDRDNEGRRSTDRDSNGPGGRSHSQSSSVPRSTTSRSRTVEKSSDTGERTSNSDNTVSDSVDAPHEDCLKSDSVSEQGIASPDPEAFEESWSSSDCIVSYCNDSKEDTNEEHITEIPEGSSSKDSGSDFEDQVKDTENSSEEKKICLSENLQLKTCKLKELRIEIDEDTYDKYQSQQLKDHGSENYNTNEQEFPSSSVHDTSSEKENIEQGVNFSDSKNSSNEALQVDNKLPKFKKPKIAANIFEVRKIMQARRRMEKKRMKFLMKNNTEEGKQEEHSTSENSPQKTTQEVTTNEKFLGFDDVQNNKLGTYDCLIQRLNSEIASSIIVDYNPNLITSWIDVNPELDNYIENVLKGKVHRKTRVRLPLISDEYYQFDAKENAYILIKCKSEESTENDQSVDDNLTNLDPISNNDEDINEDPSDIVNGKKSNIAEIKESTSNISQASNTEKTEGDITSPNNKLLKHNFDNSTTIAQNKIVKLESETKESNGVSATTPVRPIYCLTFNQTYDEILKEKDSANSVVASKTLRAEVNKSHRTIVKITNNKSSEQLVMKPAQTGFQEREIKITKTITGRTKIVPLISRVNGSKNVVSIKSHKGNGVVSPDSTVNFEAEVGDIITQQTINDVIGIQNQTKCEGAVNNKSPTRRYNNTEQKIQRSSGGARLQQRYDSSDLYKPRLQLSSRRVRGQPSPDDYKLSVVLANRKRSAAATEGTPAPKRRR